MIRGLCSRLDEVWGSRHLPDSVVERLAEIANAHPDECLVAFGGGNGARDLDISQPEATMF